MIAHSVPLVALGAFILIFGFFAFNGGSQASITAPGDGDVVAKAIVNTLGGHTVRRFVITEKAPTRAFSWLKAATTAFTFNKTLLRHYAKRALTPRSLNVKLGPRRNYYEGRAAI